MSEHDDVVIPPGLRSAMRAATSTPSLDAASDRALRARIHEHAGFVSGAASGAAMGRPRGSRWWLRSALIGGPIAAAAVVALWLSGVTATLFERESRVAPEVAFVPDPSHAAGSAAVTRDLSTAVVLARRARVAGAVGAGAPAPEATHASATPGVAAMLTAIAVSAPAAGELREAGTRFMVFDLYVDAPQSVDGVVLDLKIDDPRGVIVGIESGDAPFTEPATYDAERLARGEVRLAAISDAAANGRVRVATISLLCEAADPAITVVPISAVAHGAADPSIKPPADGGPIPVPVTWTIEPRSRS